MANNINWGKIYESTAWGSGVDNNTIGWGDSYADLAGGGPKNTIAPAISGTAERGETLTSTTGTWTGTGTITYAYQWKRNGADISGATASTYVLVAADDNALMTCVVSATDTEGTKSATSNTLGPVLAAPLNLTSPVASGTAQVGQTLSTTDGTSQGIATITFAYQWRRDAVNISGATSSTYTLVAADYSTDVDCVVTATNSLGSASADSNDILNIAGTAPVISGVPTISSQTQVGETITATAASVSGVPTPTTSWQWQRSADGSTGWANISGATSSTYTLVLADDTNYVRAVQTETNAIGSDSANSAASAQISDVPAFTGLLDTYSGAAAAYSLRQLSSTYSGDAIVVRRASDNTTQSIGFVDNELDTTSLDSFCSGTDGFVTTWYDQSGSGNDVTQSTASEQPRIYSNTSVEIEGTKPALDFLTGGSFVGASGYSFTDFAVFSVINSDSSIGYPVTCQSNNSLGWRQHLRSSGFRSRMFNVNIDALGTPTDYTLFSTLSYGNNGYTFVDGVQGATAAVTPAADTAAILEIGKGTASGATTLYAGTMQEVILYDSDQDSNRSGIETNINDFYTIY